MEIWKEIIGFENVYEISNYGKVRAYKSKKTLKPWISHDGYVVIKLKNRKNYKIHRLVAKAFIPNLKKLPCVNHKDENKQNNYVENLEWCSRKYNINYGNRNKITAKKLSKPVQQIDLSSNVIATFNSMKEASDITGVGVGNISRICNGKSGTRKKFTWKYLEKGR